MNGTRNIRVYTIRFHYRKFIEKGKTVETADHSLVACGWKEIETASVHEEHE